MFDAPILRDLLKREVIIVAQPNVPKAAPQFLYATIADEISPIEWTEALVQRWCECGAEVLLERNSVGGHLAEMTNGQGRALEWLEDAFDGRLENGGRGGGCTVRNVTVGNDTSPL